MEPIFLAPNFQKKIWGGRKLETQFNYDIPAGDIGEAWVISAHPHGPSTIENGPLKGKTLDVAYKENPEYFGNPKDPVFPLLTKILDANDSLSVQVHPDNEYARIHEGELGKTECWYVLSAEPGSYLIYGHHAKTKEELQQMIEAGDWDKLLRKVPVKAGDFFYVPSGTIHALTKGIVVLESQQSSDTTYRLYDYDRVDAFTGEKRELHLQQSIDTTTVPSTDPTLNVKTTTQGDSKVTEYLQPPVSPFFYVDKLDVAESLKLVRGEHPYVLVSIIDGAGKLVVDGQSYDVKKGTNFIIPNQVKEYELTGNMEAITSAPVEN